MKQKTIHALLAATILAAASAACNVNTDKIKEAVGDEVKTALADYAEKAIDKLVAENQPDDTADAVEAAHTVLASDLINEQLALLAGLPEEQMGLGHAFEMDPMLENGFLYELAQAEMTREIFPKATLKYMPPTKFMTGNIFRGHIQDALFNMVGIWTHQGIQLLGMPTEAIHTPFMSDRYLSIENAKYIFNNMKDIGEEMEFREGGIVRSRAKKVLDDAIDLLEKMNKEGLFAALEKGIFADVKRPKTGGKGLEEFRDFFINCNHVKLLHDYANSKVCFPNNDIKGGVCYFLYEPEHDGKAEIHFHDVNGKEFVSNRFLKDGNDDVYIRDQRLVKLKNDVWKNLKSKNIESIASPRRPYGLSGDAMLDPAKYNLPAFSETKIEDGYEVLGLIKLKRTWMYIPKDYPLPRTNGLESYKVFIARNYGAGDIGECPADPVVANPRQLCTETFIQIGAFKTREEADNLLKYIKTKFFRALVSIVKQDQNASKSVYRYVPIQIFSANSDIDWSQNISGIDHQLYQKYCLDEGDINYIENNVEEMN